MKSVTLSLVAALFFTCQVPARQIGEGLKTQNNLKQLVLAYHSYVDSKGKAPTTADELAPFFENDKKLLGMLKNEDIKFIYGVTPKEMTAGTSNTIIAYQKDAPTKGGYAAFGDGSVKKMTADEFKKATLAKAKK